jgi:diacylglycerol kinase (ATP)
MKSRSFRERLGFARAGIRIVWQREKSFRSQCVLALLAAAVTAAVRPGLAWAAAVALSVGLVLALEMMNAALEYLIDKVHPEIAEEIKFAKDAAAGGVLIASMAAALVGGLMLLSVAIARGLI